MTEGDEALQRMTTVIKEVTELVTKQNLVGFDFVFLREAFHQAGIAACGIGEASGPGRAARAAELAMIDLRKQLSLLRLFEPEETR
jgi:cell division GTPase FtsZ